MTIPLQILAQDNVKNAPNFKRVSNRKLCFFCKHLEYVLEDGQSFFVCKLYNIYMGRGDEPELSAEFCCDSYKIG